MAAKLTIDPEFAALIPPLSEEELAGLEASLLAEGCRDPLAVWQGILLDGHHRYPLCQKHGISYQTTTVELEDRPAAKVWMCRNQLNRRNLSTYQKGLLGIVIQDNLPKGVNQYDDGGKVPGDMGPRAKAAAQAGTSGHTLTEVRYLEEHADEETKDQLRRGELPVRRTYRETRLRDGAPAKDTGPASLPEFGTFAIELGDSLYKYLAHGDPRADKLELVLEKAADLTISARHNLYYSLVAVADRVAAAMERLRASGPVDVEPPVLEVVAGHD